jgi:hypothetical protein
MLGRLGKAEQVVRGPSQGFGPIAPMGKEAVAIIDGLVPPIGLDMIGTAALKNFEGRREGGGGR